MNTKVKLMIAVVVLASVGIGMYVKYLVIDRPQKVASAFIEQRNALLSADREAMAEHFTSNVSTYLKYARAAEAVYLNDSTERMEEVLEGYSFSLVDLIDENCFKAQAGVNSSTRHLLVVFRGSVPDCNYNAKANLEQGITGNAAMYNSSRNFVEKVKEKYKGYRLTLVGHSLGGGLAINNGIAYGSSDVYTFNTAYPNSMGVESIQLVKWTVDNVVNGGVQRTHITNLIMEGDEISGLSLFKFHGLVGDTFMLFHKDIPARSRFDHPIKEMVYKLEIIDSLEKQDQHTIGFNSFVGSKMEL